jgi:DNA-binding response OmpR family regulator
MAEDASSPKGRILVIDDDRSARLLLERVLTRAGHQVVLVETAASGLDALAREPFDLVITDKNLPDVDGFELLHRARELEPAVQLVLMTGFPTPETRSHAQELGVHAYVTKPFGVHDMLAVCESALRAARGGAQ